MASKQVKLTPDDALQILASVVEEIRTTGLRVGVRNAPANDKRSAGILLFIEGVSVKDGEFVMNGGSDEK